MTGEICQKNPLERGSSKSGMGTQYTVHLVYFVVVFREGVYSTLSPLVFRIQGTQDLLRTLDSYSGCGSPILPIPFCWLSGNLVTAAYVGGEIFTDDFLLYLKYKKLKKKCP